MTSLMPVSGVDTFTGSNGTSLANTNWVIALNEGSGGSWTIQGNQGRIRTGTTQFNRTSVRVNRADLADGEAVFEWVVPAAGTMFPAFYARAGANLNGDGGYYFLFNHGTGQIELGKWVPNFNGVSLSNISYTFTPGVLMKMRIAIFGSRIRMRLWPQANTEVTSTWDMDFTDSGTQPTTGKWGFTNSSATAGSKDFFVDNFDLQDVITPSQATITVTGSTTPTGALTKKTIKTFIGSTTPTGALTKIKVVAKVFTGTTTPTGVLKKITIKTLTGATTPSGVLKKFVSKKYTGSTTPTGLILKKPSRKFTGSTTPTGAMLRQQFGRIFGRPGIVVVTHRLVGEVRTRIRRS
jgi:hypothetical protein